MPRKFSWAVLACAVVLGARVSGGAWLTRQQGGSASQGAQNPPAQQQKSPVQAPQNPGTTSQSPQQPALAPAQQAPETLTTVVIDPGHGGPDTGARGPSGTEEKDVVMDFARDTADALRAEGFTVVMTRISDVDPSLDERDAVANAQKEAIFISLHVGSTGPAGTARTYTYLFPSAVPQGTASTPQQDSATSSNSPRAAAPAGFLSWREAQKPFLTQSAKLGDLIQVELAVKFKGSPEVSESAPVGVLRSVTAPAVAVEISNIGEDEKSLQSMSGDLAAGIARAVAAYKTIYPPGGKS